MEIIEVEKNYFIVKRYIVSIDLIENENIGENVDECYFLFHMYGGGDYSSKDFKTKKEAKDWLYKIL